MKKTNAEVVEVVDQAIDKINDAEVRSDNLVEGAKAPMTGEEEVPTPEITNNIAEGEEGEEGHKDPKGAQGDKGELFKTKVKEYENNIDLYKNNPRYDVMLDEEENRWVIKDKTSDSKRYIPLETTEENK